MILPERHQQMLAAGYVAVGRFVGRFTGANLPAPGGLGALALGPDANRIDAEIYNAAASGTLDGYWDHEVNVDGAEAVIPPGATKNWPIGPANAIYVAGVAGADLRVSETILVHPNIAGVRI